MIRRFNCQERKRRIWLNMTKKCLKLVDCKTIDIYPQAQWWLPFEMQSMEGKKFGCFSSPPPPPFGGNLLVGRNPFFEIPFAGLPPTFEAGFRCWGTITKVFALLRNEKEAWPHTSLGAGTQQEFEKEKSKIPINWNPKQVWSKVYCSDIWGCGRGNYGGPRQLRVLAWAQFCDSLLAPVVREACNGTEAASCHSFMT